jgi:hypothetical protein
LTLDLFGKMVRLSSRTRFRGANMRAAARIIIAGSVFFFAGGCGENKIKLDVARSLSDNAAVSTTRVAAYFDATEAQRRLAMASFVARDPSCMPSRHLRVQYRTSAAKKAAPLCPAGGVAAQGYRLDTMDFGASPAAVLKARLLMISAVADYGRALAKILDGKSEDIGGELTAFAGKVDRVGSLLDLIDRDQVPSLSGQLQSARGKSILALVQFASDLQHEAAQVGDVAQRVRIDGAKVDAALDDLRSEVLIRAAATATGAAYLNRDALTAAYREQRSKLDFAGRRAMVMEIFAAEDDEAQIPARARLVADALAETKAAQQGLRNALDNKFTPAQRRKAAAENLDRITRALKMVADIGAAFL